jgi:hypothetical protein
VAALAHPRHDVAQLGAVGARAVNDEGQVEASSHRDAA